jgi:hypothetical protein
MAHQDEERIGPAWFSVSAPETMRIIFLNSGQPTTILIFARTRAAGDLTEYPAGWSLSQIIAQAGLISKPKEKQTAMYRNINKLD